MPKARERLMAVHALAEAWLVSQKTERAPETLV
jgi:hypothetical protein